MAHRGGKRWIVIDEGEIAGDGETPHACILPARRLLVPNAVNKAPVALEGLQNQSAQVWMALIRHELALSISSVQPAKYHDLRSCVRLVRQADGHTAFIV